MTIILSSYQLNISLLAISLLILGLAGLEFSIALIILRLFKILNISSLNVDSTSQKLNIKHAVKHFF